MRLPVGEAGRAQVQFLYRKSSRPDDISNNQARHSYDSLTGRCGLDVDGDGSVISIVLLHADDAYCI